MNTLRVSNNQLGLSVCEDCNLTGINTVRIIVAHVAGKNNIRNNPV